MRENDQPVFDVISKQRSIEPKSTLLSAVAHCLAALIVFTLGGPALHFVAQPQHVNLVAPFPGRASGLKPLLRIPHRAKMAQLPPQLADARLTLPRIELPQAPAVEPVHTAVPATELPRSVSVPEPVAVKTGEFSKVAAATPGPVPQPPVVQGAFAAVETSSSRAPRGTLTASGFGSAALRELSPARNPSLHASGFSQEAPSVESPRTPKAAIKEGAFGDTTREDVTVRASKLAATGLSTPVEILSKPRPLYTQEARTLGIEGEVLVQVVFEASGTARVERLIKGLGHGLDESALAAAREIHFKPARRDGSVVDSTATVHIVFQLTY